MNKETRDQIAAVMMQHGTPKQKLEALAYCRKFERPKPASHLTMILRSLQDGEITVSRAKECIEAGDNFQPDWLPPSVCYFGEELPIDVCKRLKAQLELTNVNLRKGMPKSIQKLQARSNEEEVGKPTPSRLKSDPVLVAGTLGLPVNHEEAVELAYQKAGESNLARCYLDLLK